MRHLRWLSVDDDDEKIMSLVLLLLLELLVKICCCFGLKIVSGFWLICDETEVMVEVETDVDDGEFSI